MPVGPAEAVIGSAVGELRFVETLQETNATAVSLMEDSGGRPYVLKRYKAVQRAAERERDFLRLFGGRPGRALKLPRVVDSGDRYLLVEYVRRERVTRETVVERSWSNDDVLLWAAGLAEFQSLKPRRRTFTAREQLLGFAYPAFRGTQQLFDRRSPLSVRQRVVMLRLVVAYLLARPFFRNVCTHYDLQTYNYAFALDERKMSMLDFEFSYYLGDPYFDPAYFVMIPPTAIPGWTFQSRVLGAFSRARGGVARRTRLRLILVSCALSRYRHFTGDETRQRPYQETVDELLDRRGFGRIWGLLSR